MRNFFSLFCLFIFLSCNNYHNNKNEIFCIVNYDSLIRNLDSARLDIGTFSMYDSIEVRDTSVTFSGEGSVFHFDKNGKLGLYAFMKDYPNTNFMIVYDSNGKKSRLQENEVLRWQYVKPKTDSLLKLSVWLCAVDRNYGNLEIQSGKFIDSTLKLFETTFSKIIYFRTQIPFNINSDSIKVYLRGELMEKCTKQKFAFIDSTIIYL